ncbi:type II secretion system minor pseudopilin GspI [Luteimonas sp. SJ-92]|uniref:Type II secretion system protein I n=2 Tax=Luteimonas salinisoli TaxID=2752307 RepID=A0A853JBK5_9GAMM|nr:type II secretion system minor pseudopilin GspI [Luteimonas salinisoli]
MVGSREAESGSRGRFIGVSRGDGIIVDKAIGSRQRGFSLLEMLVAMAVFGLVVIALLNLSGENTRTTAIVEERVLAGVVAENRAVEAATEPLPALAGATQGSERLGDRDWDWTRTVNATDDAAIVRVEVMVMPAGSDRVAAGTTLFREVQ